MTNIVVAFSKAEDARSIKNILTKNGFKVVAVCTSGAQAISSLEDLNGGVLVCGYRFADMVYRELNDCMPKGFDMLLLASASRLDEEKMPDISYLPMPLKVHDLIDTLENMCRLQDIRKKKMRQRPVERNKEERQSITEAKELLMERNNMTEAQAHRYIQKHSMDNGTNMVETALMIISLMKDKDAKRG